MNRRELIQAIADHTEVDRKTVDEVMGGFTDVVLATVRKGDPVVMSGFAKFIKRKTAKRRGRNPATGEEIWIKAKTTAKITPLKGFKDVVMGEAPAPKLNKPKAKPAAKKKPAKKKAAAKKTATKKKTTAKKKK